MTNKKEFEARVLGRRESLRLLGAAGASALVGRAGLMGLSQSSAADGWPVAGVLPWTGSSGSPVSGLVRAALFSPASRNAIDVSQLSCVTKPALTEGPFFVDELLNRSDIRSDPSSGIVKTGAPFKLTINVYRAGSSACTPITGAYVDVWHCDGLGAYSDESAGMGNPDTKGQKFLRGYQVTDANGSVTFSTIYPGYYAGRTTHIHYKIRLFQGITRTYEFTSQLFFDDSLTDQVYAVSPYNTKAARQTRNNNDGIYQSGGTGTLLNVVSDGQGGYSASFDLGLSGVPQTLSSISAVSAASYSPDGVANDGIAALFGADLAATTASTPSTTLPTTLGGVQLFVRDSGGSLHAAGLFFVGPTQINFLVPPAAATGSAVLYVLRDGTAVGQGVADIRAVGPALFTANADGKGVPAALVLRVRNGTQTYEDLLQYDAGSKSFVLTPIDLGPATDQVFLVAFGTGFRHRSAISAVNATIGGVNAQAMSAGAHSFFVGLDQANILIPRSLAGRGNADVNLTVDGIAANGVTINLK